MQQQQQQAEFKFKGYLFLLLFVEWHGQLEQVKLKTLFSFTMTVLTNIVYSYRYTNTL
jgi:hypothetical protein